MNQHEYINKNGMPAVCWICQSKYKTLLNIDANGIWWQKQVPRDENYDTWYVRAAPKGPHSMPNLIYIAHSYEEARARQVAFLEKAKRNIKR